MEEFHTDNGGGAAYWPICLPLSESGTSGSKIWQVSSSSIKRTATSSGYICLHVDIPQEENFSWQNASITGPRACGRDNFWFLTDGGGPAHCGRYHALPGRPGINKKGSCTVRGEQASNQHAFLVLLQSLPWIPTKASLHDGLQLLG